MFTLTVSRVSCDRDWCLCLGVNNWRKMWWGVGGCLVLALADCVIVPSARAVFVCICVCLFVCMNDRGELEDLA